ncbi:DUF6884 domain-containing protein [Micromonospora sp. NPDC049836]|uniref:DUF6884 domain-containing protein n=1 Tax=Micromonospora sp. NPDC049836 TaxID=3364274 RepID=UPI0037B527AC
MAQWTALSVAFARGEPSVRLTWPELDRMVGGLPPSAARHRAWWSGDRPHVRAWRSAGYTVGHLVLGQEVTFLRTASREEGVDQPSARVSRSERAARPDLLLLSCSQTKLDMPAPASRLYTSPLFRKGRAYAEQLGVPWFILSAEHALVTPDQILTRYERYLPSTSDKYRAAWGLWVAERLDLLAGPLNGRVVEVHAGAAYVDAIASHLTAKGAHLVDPLRGMAIGARLHWYDTQLTAEALRPIVDGPGVVIVDNAVERLSSGDAAVTPNEFLASQGAHLKVPGLYSWWVDEAGAADLSRGLQLPVASGLIYAGLAGATRWPSGKRSTNTLWSRIAGMHLGGNHEFSTFRRTLGAILANAAGLDRIEENSLTTWMYDHLKIVTVPSDDADTLGKLEEAVLREMSPPLNLKAMTRTAVRARITELRRRYA